MHTPIDGDLRLLAYDATMQTRVLQITRPAVGRPRGAGLAWDQKAGNFGSVSRQGVARAAWSPPVCPPRPVAPTTPRRTTPHHAAPRRTTLQHAAPHRAATYAAPRRTPYAAPRRTPQMMRVTLPGVAPSALVGGCQRGAPAAAPVVMTARLRLGATYVHRNSATGGAAAAPAALARGAVGALYNNGLSSIQSEDGGEAAARGGDGGGGAQLTVAAGAGPLPADDSDDGGGPLGHNPLLRCGLEVELWLLGLVTSVMELDEAGRVMPGLDEPCPLFPPGLTLGAPDSVRASRRGGV